ncbi:hypothetical protein [Moorena producens]|uniref:hypothetical protein n=1 Tax=Moorena producens TaxID=1155739 RepID=UPI003C743044
MRKVLIIDTSILCVYLEVRCSFGAATRTHLVGWALPVFHFPTCPNLPEQCPPTADRR